MSESIPNTMQHILDSYLSLSLIDQKEINPKKMNRNTSSQQAHVDIHFSAEKKMKQRERKMMRKKHRALQKSNKCNKQKMSCSPGCALWFFLVRSSCFNWKNIIIVL